MILDAKTLFAQFTAKVGTNHYSMNITVDIQQLENAIQIPPSTLSILESYLLTLLAQSSPFKMLLQTLLSSFGLNANLISYLGGITISPNVFSIGIKTPALESVVPYSVVLSDVPSAAPSVAPSPEPSPDPSSEPSLAPTSIPSLNPTFQPSFHPSYYSSYPSLYPSFMPSSYEYTFYPSFQPSFYSSFQPSFYPSIKSSAFYPSFYPSLIPSIMPTVVPTIQPVIKPTTASTFYPTTASTFYPTTASTFYPTTASTFYPTTASTFYPTLVPTTSYPLPNFATINPTIEENSAFANSVGSAQVALISVSCVGLFMVILAVIFYKLSPIRPLFKSKNEVVPESNV